jgi:hypothetical protein
MNYRDKVRAERAARRLALVNVKEMTTEKREEKVFIASRIGPLYHSLQLKGWKEGEAA